MMKRLVTILAGLLFAACGGNAGVTDVVRYDFGTNAGKWSGASVPIAAVDVQSASWLAGPAMHFRLAYAEPLRRRSYAESRWDAPPAELLDAFLKRRIIYGQPDFSGTGCRLQLMLSELQQRFDEPQSSTLVLEVHALLTPLRSAEILSKRAFVIQTPVAVADARGGAAAARDAVDVLAGDLGGWMTELSRDKPAVAGRCRT